jgi:hypothetical protein
MRPPQDDRALLVRLSQCQAEFVVIGGICGVFHGVPLVTLDLDLCCPFTRDNLLRIQSSIQDLHPFHRMTPNKMPLQITDDLASRLKNLYLQTDLGVLDCLSEVKGIGDYASVLERSVAYRSSFGDVRMLNIDALITAKRAMGRQRDLEAVRLLEAIKEKNGPGPTPA